jgi:transcriptional regulator GlxA family with amidase domain
VSETFASVDATHHPLIVAACASTVAATLLDCFSSTLDRRSDSTGESVPSLNRAVSFIHRRAMDDIGVHDIAASVHLTPRAVQYLFRRELDTTPTEYLRHVRLHRAHQDLIAGDRSVTTVGAIAAKWGFAHTGRFAVLYRQTYGQSPHTTLRT